MNADARAPLRLQLVVAFHQPLSAGHNTLEQAVAQCYRPIVDALEASNRLQLAVHFSGHVLDFLTKHDEQFLFRIKDLVQAGRVEVLGGAFYGAIPALTPELDITGQVEMMTEFWESYLDEAPRGFWLPELTWSVETPRLLQETGLEYGFVSASQLLGDVRAAGLGSVERAGQRLPVFVMDDGLSAALPARPVDEWVDALVDRGDSEQPVRRVKTVWVRAESLGWEPGTHRWCIEEGWLREFFAALDGGRSEVLTQLPALGFTSARPGRPVWLADRVPPEHEPFALEPGAPVSWTDFPRLIAEVETLCARMTYASDKLRDAVATMEDEGTEPQWSDRLATAQRALFAAQSPDAYWRGATAGFSDPELREATYARIIEAEKIVDDVVQGEDDYLATVEDDRDGDSVPEAFVANAHMQLWTSGVHGALVRSIDNRTRHRTVLDVGTRRGAPPLPSATRTESPAEPLPRRGDALQQVDSELPSDVDAGPRRGIRDWQLDTGVSAAEFFSGSAPSLLSGAVDWEVRSDGIVDDDNPFYCLSVHTAMPLDGVRPRRLEVAKSLALPIDAARLQLSYQFNLLEGEALLWAVELPIRLGAPVQQMTADGSIVAPGTQELFGFQVLTVVSAAGEKITARAQAPVDWWCADIHTVVRDLQGYRTAAEGMVLVPTFEVSGQGQAGVSVELEE